MSFIRGLIWRKAKKSKKQKLNIQNHLCTLLKVVAKKVHNPMLNNCKIGYEIWLWKIWKNNLMILMIGMGRRRLCLKVKIWNLPNILCTNKSPFSLLAWLWSRISIIWRTCISCTRHFGNMGDSFKHINSLMLTFTRNWRILATLNRDSMTTKPTTLKFITGFLLYLYFWIY